MVKESCFTPKELAMHKITNHLNSKTSLFFTIVCTLFLSGCDKDVHDHPELTTGKQLFEYHCSSCHKSTGTGHFLKGVPANKDTDLAIWQIKHKIKNKASQDSKTKMPAFPNMSPEEASLIANYVKNL